MLINYNFYLLPLVYEVPFVSI